MIDSCVFCDIVAGTAPAEIVGETRDSVLFVPLNPVTLGHVLVVPKEHVDEASTEPIVTGRVMVDAAGWAARTGLAFNLITSAGRAATQTVFHLHVHYIPRAPGDGLALPWTGQQAAGQ